MLWSGLWSNTNQHAFRFFVLQFSLFLSPPITSVDGGGSPLANLQDELPPGVASAYDQLSLSGARLADAILSQIPFKGSSAHDPGRVLIGTPDISPALQANRILEDVFEVSPVSTFKVHR